MIEVDPAGATVLVVDDDPVFRRWIRGHLERDGYRVCEAGSAAEGLDAVDTQRPDIVLVDYRMPITDGLEFCRRLRDKPAYTWLPVILLSQIDSLVVTDAAVKAGVNDFLDKGASTGLLSVRLRAALRSKRLADLAQQHLQEVKFLADLGRRLSSTLRLEEVLSEAMRAFERFSPSRAYVLQMSLDEAPTLHTFGEPPPSFDDPELRAVIERSRAAFSAHIEAFEVHLAPTPWPWTPKTRGVLLCHAATAGKILRTFVALQVEREPDDEQRALFQAVVDRVAGPLENACLHRKVLDANKSLRETYLALGRAQAERVSAERLASVGQLAAGIAHEINNPLAFVISNLNVCRDYVRDLGRLLTLYRAGDKAAAEALALRVDPEFLLADLEPLIEETLEGGDRVHQIVRKLRGFTQIQGPDAAEDLNLQSVVESVLNVLHGELRTQALLRREMTQVPKIRGDRGKLSQVFINLTMNAVSSLPPGRCGEVTVRLFSRGGEVGVAFSDNGVGIPRERLARVFEPFEGRRDIASGGLDLAICDEIVRQHGGRIDVTSELGQGSTFTVWLPGRSTMPLPRITVHAMPDEGPRGHVLFVDDERFLLNAYERAFSGRVHVHLAHGGDEAIKMLDSNGQIDVVLCDLVMPRVSGVEVYAWVRANRPDLGERFVLVTGGQQSERYRDFVQRTGLPVIHKPFRVREIIDHIEPLLDHAARARRTAD